MVVAALKAGITPGVSPLVVLFCWGALGKLAQGESGTRFLALAQVSGSAAMPVVSGCVFAGPLLQVLYLQKAQAALSDAGIDCNLETMSAEISREEPRLARKSQKEPGGAGGSREEPGGAGMAYSKPGGLNSCTFLT